MKQGSEEVKKKKEKEFAQRAQGTKRKTHKADSSLRSE
jgi:hypothetical protein